MVSSTLFASNAAATGGAVYLTSASEVNLTSTVATSNAAQTGGFALLSASTLRCAADCDFISNSAQVAGGALALTQAALADINDGEFMNNTAGERGGALGAEEKGTLRLLACSLEGNAAQDGGAVASDSTVLYLQGTTFEGNVATGVGGALALQK